MVKKLSISCLLFGFTLMMTGCGSSSAPDSSADPRTSSSSSGNGSPSSSASSSSGAVATPIDNIDDNPIDTNATEFFFSYDESASTASRDLTLSAIQNGGNVDSNWGRPYEFLNAENFPHFNPEAKSPFTVSMGLYKAQTGEIAVGQEYTGDLYSLGVNISGPVLTKEDRPNVVLTLLLDVSGSMESPYAAETRADLTTLLDVAKHALLKLPDSLKEGDVINLLTFDTDAETLITDWVYSEADTVFAAEVSALFSRGSTNLDEGISLAYEVAQASYDANKSNRVVIFTDAIANTGQVDSSIIAENTVINNLEGIYFSGVGIGSQFNDAFLNNLTDIGKGTYSAMITPTDAETIMTDGFMRFMDSALTNVKFKLTYPQSLDHLQSAAEDISTDESEVSEINFAYNSSQFFLEMFNGDIATTDELTFTATFEYDGAEQSIEIKKTAEELIANGADEIKSAVMATRLAKIVGGDIGCEDVQRSDIYGQAIEADIFQTYRKAISDYCGPLQEEFVLPANCKVEGERVLCIVEGS